MTTLAASPLPTPATAMRPPRAAMTAPASPGPAGSEAADTPSFGAWLLQASGPPQADAAAPAHHAGPDAPRPARPHSVHPGHATPRPAQGAAQGATAAARVSAGSAPAAQGAGTVEDTPPEAQALAAEPTLLAPATALEDQAAAPVPASAEALRTEAPVPATATLGVDGQLASMLRAGKGAAHAGVEAGRLGTLEASRLRTRESLEKAALTAQRESGQAEATPAAQGTPGIGSGAGANGPSAAAPANGSPAAPAPAGAAQAAIPAPAAFGVPGPLAAPSTSGAPPTPAGAPPLFVLSPALDSPTFAPALGLQLSVLARDGIEQARMQLNPEALGPVSVQLSLTGQRVELEFVAAHARTREALEQALPQLASALGDAGFTLTGGGVFQQPRHGRQPQPQQPDHPGASSPAARAAEPSEPVTASLRPAAAARGLVDLYA